MVRCNIALLSNYSFYCLQLIFIIEPDVRELAPTLLAAGQVTPGTTFPTTGDTNQVISRLETLISQRASRLAALEQRLQKPLAAEVSSLMTALMLVEHERDGLGGET